MKRVVFHLIVITLLMGGMLISCNKDEPEQLLISVSLPESITLKDTYGVTDTFKFSIRSEEAVIDSVRLYEEEKLHVALGSNDFGPDKRVLNTWFVYNPNSSGIKNFLLEVKASPYRETCRFSVAVKE